jgi:hypothetical protein
MALNTEGHSTEHQLSRRSRAGFSMEYASSGAAMPDTGVAFFAFPS